MPGTTPQDPLAASGTSAAGSAAPEVPAARPNPGPVRSGGRRRVLGSSLAWLAVALGAGVAVGVLIGFLNRVTTDQSDGWEGLVAIIVGMLAGILAATIVWIVAMTLATRRFVQVGRRLGVLGWSALAVVGTPLAVGGVLTLLGSSGARASVLLTAVAALVVAPPALVAARVPRPGAPTGAATDSMAR